jgi:hypothetical protein
MSPNYCRPATGPASANCRQGTRTEVSSIYRARTYCAFVERVIRSTASVHYHGGPREKRL